MPDTTQVLLDFKDAHRRPIKDKVRVTFENFKAEGESFRTEISNFPALLTEVAAFSLGMWTVHIQPERYRAKSFFLQTPTDDPVTCEEFFFLHADRARPNFTSPDKLFSDDKWKALADVLKKSTVDGLSGKELYAELVKKKNHLRAAGLLNLHARSQAVTLDSGNTAFSHFEKVVLILQDRIYATVGDGLHGDVVKSVKKNIISPAKGNLHEFPIPGDFQMLKKDASFKTPEKAGNLQLTFAKNASGKMVVDADVDEAKGIKHAFEVLSHVFTGGRTHPYDIHQILTFFYRDIELGYDIVPA